MAIGIGVVGVVDMIAILGVFYLAMQRYPDHLEAAQTIAFVTLCTSELIRAFTARSEYHSVFSIGLFSNRWMVGRGRAVVRAGARGGVRAVPRSRSSTPCRSPPDDWLLMLPFFFASPVAMELLKIYFRRRQASPRRTRRPVAPADVAAHAAGDAPAAQRSHRRERHAEDPAFPSAAPRNDRFAVQDVIKRFMNDTAMEVHLLNVQTPFSADIAHFSSRKSRHDYHREQAEKALAPAREMLDKHSDSLCGAHRRRATGRRRSPTRPGACAATRS